MILARQKWTGQSAAPVKTEHKQKLIGNAKPLDPPDNHHLHAAEGWLELGDHIEANEELKKIGLTGRFHPQVLLTRWEIYARARHWEFAHTIAQGMVALMPDEPVGWINRSYALHQLKRTREAWYSLLPPPRNSPNTLPSSTTWPVTPVNSADSPRPANGSRKP